VGSSLGSMKEKDRQLNFRLKNCSQEEQTFAFESARSLSTCASLKPFALGGFRDNFQTGGKLMTIDSQLSSYLFDCSVNY
jgi:hypothetical protein